MLLRKISAIAGVVLGAAIQFSSADSLPPVGDGVPSLKIRSVEVGEGKDRHIDRVEVLWSVNASGYILKGATDIFGPFKAVTDVENPITAPGRFAVDMKDSSVKPMQYFILAKPLPPQ